MAENLDQNPVFNSGVLYYQLVSYQPSTFKPLSKEISVNQALSEIKTGVYKQQITKLREAYAASNKDVYDGLKKQLPAVTFCGTFENQRKKESLKSYNFVIILDIDKLEISEFSRVKDCLLKDPYVITFWVSPSKNGFKGLVPIQYKCEINISNVEAAHTNAFDQVAIYFSEKYNIKLDPTGKDLTRLCYFSFDTNIIIKRITSRFEIIGIQFQSTSYIKSTAKRTIKNIFISSRDARFNPKNRNNNYNRYVISAIIRYLTKRHISITNSYDEWYKVAMAISNSFTYEIGVKYFLKISSIDKEKYNELNCINFLEKCYQNRNGSIKFNTIIFYANKHGYLTKSQRERGTEAATSK